MAAWVPCVMCKIMYIRTDPVDAVDYPVCTACAAADPDTAATFAALNAEAAAEWDAEEDA